MKNDNSFESSIGDLAKNQLIPRITEALSKRLEEKMVQCTDSSELIAFIGDLSYFHEDLKQGILYSPYRSLSEPKRGYISKARFTLAEGVDLEQVRYNGNYYSFGDALTDFIEQTGLTRKTIADRANVSTATLTKILHNNYNPMNPKTKGCNTPEAIRARILGVFDIRPEGSREEMEKLPTYGS